MHTPIKRELLSIALLEERIDYSFKDPTLLERAITHRSFSADHYERLEFLGDSVLNCVVGHALFLRDKHFTEGVLSRVRANFVCEKTLDEIAQRLEIPNFIRLGEGELNTGGATRPSIIADVCEAIFGAVYLDGGFEEARRVILRLYEPILLSDTIATERLIKDAKTRLQEYLQGARMKLPKYAIEEIRGADHNQVFSCSCTVIEKGFKTFGEGKSRRAAEQFAAEKMLDQLNAEMSHHE